MVRLESLQKNFRKCPECGNKLIVQAADESGETVCSQCGLVLGEQPLDTRPEWKAYTPEERNAKSRIGSPVSILKPDKGLSTVIPTDLKDTLGRGLSPEAQTQMQHIRKWQTRVPYRPQERNLLQALTELDRLVDQLHVSHEIQEQAAHIYRDALNRGVVRGRSIVGMMAAALHVALRTSGHQRTLEEIASISPCKKRNIAQHYRFLMSKLDLKAPVQDPKTYISKIASNNNLPGKTETAALDLLEEIDKKNVFWQKSYKCCCGGPVHRMRAYRSKDASEDLG
ncbi:MAG: TFIIB-type zinc ribbon-containing protein [Candidatus Bathyarchaeota archaeon]